MDRRDFLKTFGSTIVLSGCSLPIPELGLDLERPPFDRLKEYGSAIALSHSGNSELTISLLHEARLFLIDDALKFLPHRTPFEIRLSVPTNYGRDQAMAWYYSPAFLGELRDWPDWNTPAPEAASVREEPHYDAAGGYYHYGRFFA
ncbi:MAG: hypothetical protein ACR2RF_25270 [Geminicoccaceae bacterium]